MNNKFYGIGVGVGDPEEITIKAINTLKIRCGNITRSKER